MTCSDSKSGCYSEYINWEEAGTNLGWYRCFYTLFLDGVWEILLSSLGRRVHFSACIPLDLIPANIWSDFCMQEVSEKKSHCKSSCECAFIRGFAPPANASSISFQQTFGSRVNLPCAAPPGLCSLRETGLDLPHSEGRSWQCSAPPSASWQVFTWNHSDLLIYPWHPTKHICWSRSPQRLKGRAEKIWGWADSSLHFSCFIQVQRWVVKVCVINQ